MAQMLWCDVWYPKVLEGATKIVDNFLRHVPLIEIGNKLKAIFNYLMATKWRLWSRCFSALTKVTLDLKAILTTRSPL